MGNFIIKEFYNFSIHHKWSDILPNIWSFNLFNHIISYNEILVVAYKINSFFIRKSKYITCNKSLECCCLCHDLAPFCFESKPPDTSDISILLIHPLLIRRIMFFLQFIHE